MAIFAGTLDSLEPIREYVGLLATEAGLASTASYNLCLAVDEIAANIVMHGYEEGDRIGDIVIDGSIERGTLTIRIGDTTQGYDPQSVAFDEATLGKPLEERPIGGLGLFLVHDAVDEFRYERGETGNVHELVVRLSEKP